MVHSCLGYPLPITFPAVLSIRLLSTVTFNRTVLLGEARSTVFSIRLRLVLPTSRPPPTPSYLPRSTIHTNYLTTYIHFSDLKLLFSQKTCGYTEWSTFIFILNESQYPPPNRRRRNPIETRKRNGLHYLSCVIHIGEPPRGT